MHVELEKTKMAVRLLGRVCGNVWFCLSVAAASFAILAAIVWTTNFQALIGVLISPLGLWEKVRFVLSVPEFLVYSFTLIQSVLIGVFSVLQGLNISLLVRLIRRKRKQVTLTASSNVAATVAVGGIGCAACGTTAIGSLLAGFGFSSVLLVEYLGVLVLVAGVILSLYSLRYLLLLPGR